MTIKDWFSINVHHKNSAMETIQVVFDEYQTKLTFMSTKFMNLRVTLWISLNWA